MKQARPLSLLLIIFIVGCATPQTPSESLGDFQTDLKAGDVLANGSLEVRRADLTQTPEFTGATVNLVNKKGQPLTLNYLFHWYEKDGTEAYRGRPQWRQASFSPGQPVTVSGSAPVPWCTRFGLELQEPQGS